MSNLCEMLQSRHEDMGKEADKGGQIKVNEG